MCVFACVCLCVRVCLLAITFTLESLRLCEWISLQNVMLEHSAIPQLADFTISCFHNEWRSKSVCISYVWQRSQATVSRVARLYLTTSTCYAWRISQTWEFQCENGRIESNSYLVNFAEDWFPKLHITQVAISQLANFTCGGFHRWHISQAVYFTMLAAFACVMSLHELLMCSRRLVVVRVVYLCPTFRAQLGFDVTGLQCPQHHHVRRETGADLPWSFWIALSNRS
jgi:hypothetical protein